MRQDSFSLFDQRLGMLSRPQDDPVFLDFQLDASPRFQAKMLSHGQWKYDPTGNVGLEPESHTIKSTPPLRTGRRSRFPDYGILCARVSRMSCPSHCMYGVPPVPRGSSTRLLMYSWAQPWCTSRKVAMASRTSL